MQLYPACPHFFFFFEFFAGLSYQWADPEYIINSMTSGLSPLTDIFIFTLHEVVLPLALHYQTADRDQLTSH